MIDNYSDAIQSASVRSEGRGRSYSFGCLASEIGLAKSERANLTQLCKPDLVRIAEETGAPVFLMVRSGAGCICTGRAMSSYPIKTFVDRRLGIGAGSLIPTKDHATKDRDFQAYLARQRQAK